MPANGPKKRLGINKPTVARPTAVRPTIRTPLRSKCSSHLSSRGLKSRTSTAFRGSLIGPEHSETALSLDSLASLYQAMGEYTKAEPLFEEALRIQQKVLGEEHPVTAQTLNIFMDVDSLTPGVDFVKEIKRVWSPATC